MDLLSPTRGLRSLRDDGTPGKQQEIEPALVGLYICETPIRADIDCGHNFVLAKICTGLNKMIQF